MPRNDVGKRFVGEIPRFVGDIPKIAMFQSVAVASFAWQLLEVPLPRCRARPPGGKRGRIHC